MPVTVSLFELASLPGTKPAWPSEFRGFVETIESAPDDRTNYLVLADWLRDQGEEWLEKACRYSAKNTEMTLQKGRYCWAFNYPAWLQVVPGIEDYDPDSAALALADLAVRLRKLAEELA